MSGRFRQIEFVIEKLSAGAGHSCLTAFVAGFSKVLAEVRDRPYLQVRSGPLACETNRG